MVIYAVILAAIDKVLHQDNQNEKIVTFYYVIGGYGHSLKGVGNL